MMDCPLCALNPKNHSLRLLTEEKDIFYFYTCPAEAIMYFDVEGIIYHYDLVLSKIPENKEWIWIFDASGFGLKHIMTPQVGIRLAQLITEKYSKNLKQILIYGFSSYVSTMYYIVKPFINDKMQEVIVFKSEKFNHEIELLHS